MTDEEKQEEFNRKADRVADKSGCCLIDAIIGAFAISLMLVPTLKLIG